MAVVQGNVLAYNNMDPRAQGEHLKPYQRLSTEAGLEKPDLIVWPSSSLPASISGNRLIRATVVQLARSTGAFLLVGGAGYDKVNPQKDRDEAYSNSEFLIAPSGKIEAQYNKIRLTPFNEYVPMKGIVSWPDWITELRDNFKRGDQFTVFQVGEARFGSPICWENLFPDLFRRFVLEGANLMVSATNEGFFGPTSAPYQTLAMNVFRAVENRVVVARAATTGVSAFIHANGEILDRVRDGNQKDLFVAGYLVRDVPLFSRKTFYTRHGDLFARAAIGLAVLAVLVAGLKLFHHKSRS
ncbi:MAG: apolipoprotein N-acyltransferase [Syntrophobacteraceae bacterium]